MSSRKKPSAPEPAGEPVDFEKSLAELEAIVAEMEERQLPLEDLVARYEKGARLLAGCEAVLDSARKRLQTITDRHAAGNSAAATDSLDEEDDLADDAPTPLAAPDDDDDDIRLF